MHAAFSFWLGATDSVSKVRAYRLELALPNRINPEGTNMTIANGTTAQEKRETIWQGDPNDPQDVRLRVALLDALRRLTALKDKLGLENEIVKACEKCWQRANEDAAFARYAAWDCLHQFDYDILAAMSDEERDARWCTLRCEAEEKLKGSWRSKAAECIVNQAPKDGHVPLHLVRELQTQVATAAQNQQHKLDLFQKKSLPWLTVALAAAVAAAFAFSLCALNFERLVAILPWLQTLGPSTRAEQWARALLLGIPAGALGGILSMAFALGRADLKAKIPDMRLSGLIILTRPLLGATVAIPVMVLVEAGFIKVAGFEGSLAIFAFCFLGGFSERWFLGVMERFEAGKK